MSSGKLTWWILGLCPGCLCSSAALLPPQPRVLRAHFLASFGLPSHAICLLAFTLCSSWDQLLQFPHCVLALLFVLPSIARISFLNAIYNFQTFKFKGKETQERMGHRDEERYRIFLLLAHSLGGPPGRAGPGYIHGPRTPSETLI